MYYYCSFLFFTTPLRPRTREEKPINSKLKKWWKKGRRRGRKAPTYSHIFPQMTRAHPRQELAEFDPQNTNKKLEYFSAFNDMCRSTARGRKGGIGRGKGTEVCGA